MKKENTRKGNKKNLATKICVACQKEFSRRKKRKNNWDEVKYCSNKCKSKKKHIL